MGGSGVRLTAISAAEIALWDIKGKAYGAPVAELLGGVFHAVYAPTPAFFSPRILAELDDVRRKAERFREAGFTAVKFGWGGFGKDRKRGRCPRPRRAGRRSATKRGLMIDVGLCWDSDHDARTSAGAGRVRPLLAGGADAA